MKRFILAATAAFTILTAVALDVAPVRAHHSIIVGVAGCADPQGSYGVKWTVTADAVRGLDWTIDGVTKPDSAAFTYTTSHNLTGPAPSLTKTATWSNGITSTVTGTVAKPGRCEAPLPTTTTTAPPATTTTTEAPPSTTTPTTSTTATAPIPTASSAPTQTDAPTTTSPSAPTPVASAPSTTVEGLPPLPPTTEGDATSQAPGPPPVPPSGLPKTGLKRDTARLALGLCIVGFLALAVRKVQRT